MNLQKEKLKGMELSVVYEEFTDCRDRAVLNIVILGELIIFYFTKKYRGMITNNENSQLQEVKSGGTSCHSDW